MKEHSETDALSLCVFACSNGL